MKNLLKKLNKVISKVLVTTIVLSSLSFTMNAKSYENTQKEYQIMENIFLLNDISIELNDQEIIDIHNLFINDLNNNNFNINVSKQNLNLDNITAFRIFDNDDFFISVTLPIIGDEYSIFSNFTVVYDSNNNIIVYEESTLTKSYNDTFLITSHVNGELIRQEITDIDYVDNEQLLEELEILNNVSELRRVGRNTGACLALVLGVTGAVGTIIASMCGFSCVSLAVPVCVACIAAYATIGGASINAISNCF